MLGRVHWLLWNLSSEFKGKYVLKFDYKFHNYLFYRFNPHTRKIGQVFQVIRLILQKNALKKCAEKMIALDLEREKGETFSKGFPP